MGYLHMNKTDQGVTKSVSAFVKCCSLLQLLAYFFHFWVKDLLAFPSRIQKLSVYRLSPKNCAPVVQLLRRGCRFNYLSFYTVA